MDCYFRQYWRDKRLSFKSPFKSLSLSIKVSGSSACLAVIPNLVSSEDARADVEAGHLLLQRQEVAHPHDHGAEQASQTLGERRHPVLDEVTM